MDGASEQTASVFRALAEDAHDELDLSRWQALQTWLAAEQCRVVVPFARYLADMVPPVAVRLRRDFRTVLMLIRAHALLHQATRRKDGAGRILATIEDYAAVRDLVADLVAAGVDATVRPEVRETVETVGMLIAKGSAEVKQAELCALLRLDKSAISRRVADALQRGYLRNLEDRKGRPARLVIGDPLPDEVEVRPTPERLHGCTVVSGDKEPAPPCCRECGLPDRPDDPLVDVVDGEGFIPLHRGCISRWSAAA